MLTGVENSTLNAISGCAPNTPPRPLIGSVWLYRYLIPSKQRGRPAGRPAILIGKTNGFSRHPQQEAKVQLRFS